jgi:hypothetical protein
MQMAFDFILEMFVAKGDPPRINVHNSNEGYSFAPFAGDDNLVYTSDINLWRSVNIKGCETFCPSMKDIESMLNFKGNNRIIIVLTEEGEYVFPGSDVKKSLVFWGEITNVYGEEQFCELGFDVIDMWTGISALSNIGYKNTDLIELEKSHLISNEFGLLSTYTDAISFSRFASYAAAEHAPFTPVKLVQVMCA